MWPQIDICYICLRTERNLKIVDAKLSSFHRKLCDIPIEIQNPQYCYECEYLLTKMFNFKNKCLKALDLLQKWINTDVIVRSPITSLWSFLPHPLGYHTVKNRTYSCENDDIVQHSKANEEREDFIPDTDSNSIQDIIENSEQIDEIKLESSDDTDKDKLKDFLVLKSEDTGFEEILLENDVQINDIIENDVKNDHLINKETDINKRKEDFLTDSESNDSDTLFAILQNVKRRKTNENNNKRSFDKVVNESDKLVDKRKVKRNLKIEKVKRSFAKVKNDRKINKEDGSKKFRFHTRKGLLIDMTNGFDKKFDKCTGLKKTYSKERLIQEIQNRFSSCGELVSSDGTSINKQFVLECLHDKATEYVMKQLYNTVYRKSLFKPKALKLFKCIQNKYQNLYESVFDVEYLNTKEKMYEEFTKRQTYDCYRSSEYKCEICYQGFKHEKQLQHHMKCHDKSTGDIECPVCKMRFKRRKALISHQNAHEAVYKCKLCPLITYYRNSMINHYHLHKGMKYKCEQCNATFGSVSAMRTHVSYRHARAHACTRCGRAYSTRTGLRAHLTRYHANESTEEDSTPGVKCEECALTLATWEAYNRHLRFTHKQKLQSGRPPGSTSSGARRPSALPRKRPVMTCRVCNAVGDSVGWLQLHFSEQHPAVDMSSLYADKHTHLCDVCGKSFCTIYTLQAHLNIHNNVRPYACDICNARFHRSMSLQLHKLVHQPASKPCSRCGKKFRTASNLNNHMRSHIGNRRYKCNICGKGFIHRNSVNEHVRGVHKNIRRVRKRGVHTSVRLDDVTDAAMPKHVLE